RIESKDYRPEAKPVSLRLASEQVVMLLRARTDEKRIEVGNEIPADLPHARADRRALEQVFTNLLDNAIKYCPQGATIRLRARRDADAGLRIEVSDTGPGIEPR